MSADGRQVGRGLVPIAEVHAKVAGAQLAQSEPEVSRNRFGLLERHRTDQRCPQHSSKKYARHQIGSAASRLAWFSGDRARIVSQGGKSVWRTVAGLAGECLRNFWSLFSADSIMRTRGALGHRISLAAREGA